MGDPLRPKCRSISFVGHPCCSCVAFKTMNKYDIPGMTGCPKVGSSIDSDQVRHSSPDSARLHGILPPWSFRSDQFGAHLALRALNCVGCTPSSLATVGRRVSRSSGRPITSATLPQREALRARGAWLSSATTRPCSSASCSAGFTTRTRAGPGPRQLARRPARCSREDPCRRSLSASCGSSSFVAPRRPALGLFKSVRGSEVLGAPV